MDDFRFFWNAGNLYALASAAYKRSKNSGSDSLAAVVLAVASLEGFINELAVFASTRADAPESLSILREIWEDIESKASVEVKYSLIATLLRKPFDRGANPFQDFKILVSFRNQLVHMKPEGISEGSAYGQPTKLLRALKSRHLIQDWGKGMTYSWFDQVRTPQVALWACKTASAMAFYICDVIPDGSFKASVSSYVSNGFRPPREGTVEKV